MADKPAKQGTLNRQSREMTEGVARMPNRTMLRAIGFQDEDFHKPLVGLASAGAEASPCNIHHDELAGVAKEALKRSGGMYTANTMAAAAEAMEWWWAMSLRRSRKAAP